MSKIHSRLREIFFEVDHFFETMAAEKKWIASGNDILLIPVFTAILGFLQSYVNFFHMLIQLAPALSPSLWRRNFGPKGRTTFILVLYLTCNGTVPGH